MNNRVALFVVVVLAFFLLAGFVSAVGITAGTFRGADGMMDVEQGKNASAVVILTNSPNRDNRFAVTVSGEIGGWVTNISPNNFNLSAGATKSVTINIFVPSDASIVQHTGTVTATGTQIIGSGTIGFQEAAKNTLYLYVKKSSSAQTNTTAGGSGGGIVISSNTSFCTADVYRCPGGTYVSRNPNNNCAFFACPNNTLISANITPSNTSSGGLGNNTTTCPAYYTCSDGTRVSYCEIVEQRDASGSVVSAACGCKTPQCPASGVVLKNNTNASVAETKATLNDKCGAWRFNKCEDFFAIFKDECGNEWKDDCIGCVEKKDSNGLLSYSCSSKIAVSAGKGVENKTSYYNVSITRNTNISSDEGVLQVGSASADYTGKVEVRESGIMMNTSVGEKQILVMPADAIRVSGIAGNASVTVELREKSQKPVYSVTGARQAKLLFFIPVLMQVQTDVDAETGNIISVSRPWWSFLTGG